jgi:predicted deacylase
MLTINLPVAEIYTGVFPASYVLGRQHWLTQVEHLMLAKQRRAYPCAGAGPEGEALITDTVWVGSADAKNVLVLIAGTHGIEGYAGSAIQIDFLRLLRARHFTLPPDVAVLLIHALTPWGYAWQRRCDGDGVDLNRNAVDFSKPLPENPDYDALRSALFLDDKAERDHLFSEFETKQGRVAFEKAISGGQYHDASGPFYGGGKPAHGRVVSEELIQHYGLQQRNLAVLDFHTGLGVYGHGEIICDHPPESAGTQLARRWYGDFVTLPALGTSSSVAKAGLMDYVWHDVMNGHSCYITLEFGTYSTDQLFDVLLRDHQLWAQAGNEQDRLAHSQLMRQHFCPNDPAWQEMVLFRARQVITQVLRGLGV